MNFFSDYFYYNKQQRLAIIVLSCLFLLLAFILVKQYTSYSLAPSDMAHWEASLENFEDHQTGFPTPNKKHKKTNYSPYASSKPSYDYKSNKKASYTKVKIKPQAFDPNTASEKKLLSLGLPKHSVKSILNYRNKGGKFRTKEDLARIYTLKAEHYKTLESYIQLPSKASIVKAPKPTRPLAPAFPFDPNTSSAEELATLGLAPNTIKSIINYRSKGGQFRKKEDFKKIYTLPDSVYQHLSPFIQLAEQPQKNAYVSKKKIYRSIDINTAQETDFEQFRGIGPSYARRLLEWRDRLGGFERTEQVGELFGLPDSTFQQMRPHLQCNKTILRQINVNTATLEELKSHPYLRWGQAKAIVRYRERKGPWKSIELLQILPELDDGKNTFERVRSYLRV